MSPALGSDAQDGLVGPGVSLLTRRQIQHDGGTVLEAIYHVVEHFGMHTGQMLMLSKMRAGKDLRLWQP
jgi:hypothetical protein